MKAERNGAGERGFTLVELLVAVSIIAVLSIGIVTLALAQRPGALAAATQEFDASLAAAQAVAATSGNGATIVVAPRTLQTGQKTLSGFILTVYRGRPTAANAVKVTTVMPLVSDVAIHEATLGAPPFTIFLSSAGHASGVASYPSFDARGNPVFSPVAQQPACPKGSLTLTFTSANAAQTRTLSCRTLVFGTPQPLASMSPEPVVVTPNTFVFYWPAAPAQQFVTTEWGYTRWFAANGWWCGGTGNGAVAGFPSSNPAPPYSAAYSSTDASATPQPPNEPYSYANSTTSMEDAPASFTLEPQSAGLCSGTISDAFSQQASFSAQVMGALTLSQTQLSLTTGSGAGSVTLSKIYDSVPLQGSILASTCTGIGTFAFSPGTAPTQPGTQPAVETLTVTPQTPGTCAVQIGDQYSTLGDPPATLRLTVLPTPTPVPTPTPTPVPTPTPTPVPTPTPIPCATSKSTLRGANGSCDDLYQWPVTAYECSEFNCALLFPLAGGAPTIDNLWAGVYVPHGTVLTWDGELHSGFFPYYTCYATITSGAAPTVFAYFYSDNSHASQAIANPAGFGLAQLTDDAAIPHDSKQSLSGFPATCTSRFPAPTF